MAFQILIVDDKESIIEVLDTALTREGYEVTSVTTGQEAVDALKKGDYDLMMCDVRLPDFDGTQVLKTAREIHPYTAVIMITAYGSIDNAIECMRLGAEDYITKPFNLEEIKEVMKKALEKVRLVKENIALRGEIEKKYSFGNIIGKSKQMQNVMDLVRRVAPTDVNVLIRGETGTGKELVARAIHFNSARADKPLLALNCAAMPESLIESELFGHAKGAFTGAYANKRGLFEEAHGGTFLLDEIGELQHSLQAKLLRTLDEGMIRRVGDTRPIPVNVRLLFSTNKNLQEAVENGAFRLDLYHRVRGVEIVIPPLRERKEDIPPLIDYYLNKLALEHKREIKGISPAALALLINHRWEGNVRELINILEQAVLLSEGDILGEKEMLPLMSPQKADAISVLEEKSSLKE
ncbi:MAG: sigma-54 dependent transcriptional regulator, partial [bacterium]